MVDQFPSHSLLLQGRQPGPGELPPPLSHLQAISLAKPDDLYALMSIIAEQGDLALPDQLDYDAFANRVRALEHPSDFGIAVKNQAVMVESDVASRYRRRMSLAPCCRGSP
jgi:hypothetical protein